MGSPGLGALLLAAALAAAPSAQACGYHDASKLNLGMLNLAYPDALYVRTAVWMAQRDGVIAADLGPPAGELPRAGQADIYRLLRTVGALGHLRNRLETALDGRPLPAFAIVLMKPMLWSRFEAAGSEMTLQAHAAGPAASDVVIVTDEPVVDALLDGRLGSRDAQARGLVRFYGSPAEVASVSSLFDRLTAERAAAAVVPGDAAKGSP